MPKSKRAAPPTKRANCTWIGSSRPRSWRSLRRSSRLVSCPTIWLTGSPTKRNRRKASAATVSMTNSASTRRRIAKASILLLEHPVEVNLVVRPLPHLDLARHAPRERLLMQRDDAGLLVQDLVGFEDEA